MYIYFIAGLPGACGESGDDVVQSKTYSVLSSNSDPEHRGLNLSDSLVNETTYSLEQSNLINYTLPFPEFKHEPPQQQPLREEIHTADEVSPPSCHGDFFTRPMCAESSDSTGVTEAGSSSCEFVTVPEHDGVSPTRSNHSLCVSIAEVSHSLYQTQKQTDRTVLVSKCKSPMRQSHVAKIMGCNATLMLNAKKRSLRIQARPNNTERATQSKDESKEERLIQTSPDIKGVDIQTDQAGTHGKHNSDMNILISLYNSLRMTPCSTGDIYGCDRQ